MISGIYKISVTIPQEYKDELMDSINSVMGQIYPGYDRVFSITKTEGTWRTLEGADPFNGRIGEITSAEELRIDFAVQEKDLKKVLEVIADVHPYEEPAIDVIPMIPWKDIIDP